MRSSKIEILYGMLVGFLLGVPWLAISYTGGLLGGFTQIQLKLFEWITRILPGKIVTVSLDLIISTLQTLHVGPLSKLGKLSEFGMAYLLVLLVSIGLGGVFSLLFQHLRLTWLGQGLITGSITWLLCLPIAGWRGWGETGFLKNALWLAIINFAWGFAFAWLLTGIKTAMEVRGSAGRRHFITQALIESLALSGLVLLINRWLTSSPESIPSVAIAPTEGDKPVVVEKSTVIPPTPSPNIHPTLEPSSIPTKLHTGFELVEGTRAEITPITDFYRVDINLVPPGQDDYNSNADNLTQRLLAQGGDTDLPTEGYTLIVEGLVENPLVLDLNALMAYNAVDQYATLTCISNPVGGDLISTTQFRGARLKDVLEMAQLKPVVKYVKFTCVDGYTESLPIESALDPRTLLCYAMGGKPLTQEHGAPLRLYTPGRYGMKNPKWIIKIETLDQEYSGYWEQRGWSEKAFVQTTSVIDVAFSTPSGMTEAGGIAFAGDRGIKQVEIKIDDNSEWLPASIKPPYSPLTWIQWSLSTSLPAGSHEFIVRAIDGNDQLQIEEVNDTHPNGATGYFMKVFKIK